MPEGVGYGPQFTASTGLTLNYIGRHCYAYSGNIDIASGGGNPDTVLLKFITGNEVIDADIMIGLDDQDSFIASYEINMNGQTVYAIKWDSLGTAGFVVDSPIKLIIPPLTEFELKVGISDNKQFCAILRGRVYGKID
jgi:hypothetical protein